MKHAVLPNVCYNTQGYNLPLFHGMFHGEKKKFLFNGQTVGEVLKNVFHSCAFIFIYFLATYYKKLKQLHHLPQYFCLTDISVQEAMNCQFSTLFVTKPVE